VHVEKEMPISFEFLRGVVGLIGIGCAYMLGRSVASVRRGWMKRSRVYGWTIRTLACLVAVGLRHSLDMADIAVWCLSAAAFGLAYWITLRERKEEDLTHTIFPDEP
jgi:hypothetical protein